MSDTPETDSKTNATFGNHSCATVLADFARKLERERDEARHEIEGWSNKWNIAVEMAARAEIERDEARELAHRYRSLYYAKIGIENSASWFPWENVK
jgi:hypothetical protein